MIYQFEVDIGRQDVLSDTFCDIRVDFLFIEDAGLMVFFKYTAIRIDTPDFDIRVFFFQIPGCA